MNVKEFLLKYGFIIVVGLMMLSFFLPMSGLVGTTTEKFTTWLGGIRINHSTGETTNLEPFFESNAQYDIVSGSIYVTFFIIASVLLVASCFIKNKNEKLWKIFSIVGISCMAFVFVGFTRMSLETLGEDAGYFVLSEDLTAGIIPHVMFYISIAALAFGGAILKLNLEEMK